MSNLWGDQRPIVHILHILYCPANWAAKQTWHLGPHHWSSQHSLSSTYSGVSVLKEMCFQILRLACRPCKAAIGWRCDVELKRSASDHCLNISYMKCCLVVWPKMKRMLSMNLLVSSLMEPILILQGGGWDVIMMAAPPLLSGRWWQIKSVAGASPRFSSKGIFISIFQPVTSAPQLCHRTIFQEIICS